MWIERRESFILPLAGHVKYLGIGIFLENVLWFSSFVLDDNHVVHRQNLQHFRDKIIHSSSYDSDYIYS